MWLLNAHTRKLQFFGGQDVPAYAILSHTWGEEEVSFQDLSDDPNVESKNGYAKIRYACFQAIRDGLGHCWVDTCCIDKTSSAELSEAINSMFVWYQNSRVCYAYMSDVTGGWPWFLSTERIPNNVFDEDSGLAYLASSRWFTRGWTLQELIAPHKVIFFDRDWKLIGSRASMAKGLTRITRIHPDVLTNPKRLPEFSVAKRLSWAAHRETTRQEDEAYCLLGLFSINMPLLYGEGGKAFLRLQEMIIRESTDHTIFTWDFRGKVTVDLNNWHKELNELNNYQTAALVDEGLGFVQSSSTKRLPPDHVLARKGLDNLEKCFKGELLAPSVQYFADAADISQSTSVTALRSHEITSVGLRITLPLIDDGKGHFLAVLRCQRNGRQVALELRDPTYRSGLNLRSAKTQIFELYSGETQSRLRYVLPRSIGSAKEREIIILKPRQTKSEETKENPNTMFVHFRDADQLQLKTLWPAPYWDVTGWSSRVHIPERDDIRMVTYSAASTATDAVSGIGGLTIRDRESSSAVHLCFNCRRGVVRSIPALQFYIYEGNSLQERCRALEGNYISDVRDPRNHDDYVMTDNPAPSRFPPDRPLHEDHELLAWLEADDYYQTRLERVTASTTIGSKRITATMYSEQNEHSSHTVLKIFAGGGWQRMNILYQSLDDSLWVEAVEILAKILN